MQIKSATTLQAALTGTDREVITPVYPRTVPKVWRDAAASVARHGSWVPLVRTGVRGGRCHLLVMRRRGGSGIRYAVRKGQRPHPAGV